MSNFDFGISETIDQPVDNFWGDNEEPLEEPTTWEATLNEVLSKPAQVKYKKRTHISKKYMGVMELELSDFDEATDGVAELLDNLKPFNEEPEVKPTKKETKEERRYQRKLKKKLEKKLLERKLLLEEEERLALATEREVEYMEEFTLPIYQNQALIEILNDIDRTLRSHMILSRTDEVSLFPMHPQFQSVVKTLLSVYNLDFNLKLDKLRSYLSFTSTSFSSIPDTDGGSIQNERLHNQVYFNSPTLLNIIEYLHLKWVKSLDLALIDENDFDTVVFIRSTPTKARTPGLPKPGEVVGQDASPIDDSNIGYRLLMKMGWSPKPDATTTAPMYGSTSTPLKVVFRQGRAGIGYSNY